MTVLRTPPWLRMADGWIKAFDAGAVAMGAARSLLPAPTRAAPAPTIRAATVAVPAVARAPRNDLRLRSVWFPIGGCGVFAMTSSSRNQDRACAVRGPRARQARAIPAPPAASL